MGDLERDLDFLSSFNSERLLHRVKNDYCIKNDFLNNKLKEIKKFCFQNGHPTNSQGYWQTISPIQRSSMSLNKFSSLTILTCLNSIFTQFNPSPSL